MATVESTGRVTVTRYVGPDFPGLVDRVRFEITLDSDWIEDRRRTFTLSRQDAKGLLWCLLAHWRAEVDDA